MKLSIHPRAHLGGSTAYQVHVGGLGGEFVASFRDHYWAEAFLLAISVVDIAKRLVAAFRGVALGEVRELAREIEMQAQVIDSLIETKAPPAPRPTQAKPRMVH